MKTWKSKLFGDNRMNLYGWITAGLLTNGVSLWFLLWALSAGALQSPECLLLVAIYFIVCGHFCLALQSYCARVVERIESEKKKDDDDAL